MPSYLENFISNIIILISTASPYLIILGFLIGSIPFGLLVSIIAGYGDIRKIGSGNIGATNVLRTGNRSLAALTLFMDLSKGFLPLYLNKILIIDKLNHEIISLQYVFTCLALVLGHMYSPFLKFRGGKGVATSAGILIFLSWPCFILTILIWILVAFATKKSSLGALAASLSAPIFLWSLKQISDVNTLYSFPKLYNSEIIVLVIIMIFIWFKHIPNIKRVINREEPKI